MEHLEQRLAKLGILDRVRAQLEGLETCFLYTDQDFFYLDQSQVQRVPLSEISRLSSDQSGMLNIYSGPRLRLSASLQGFAVSRLRRFFEDLKEVIGQLPSSLPAQEEVAAKPQQGAGPEQGGGADPPQRPEVPGEGREAAPVRVAPDPAAHPRRGLEAEQAAPLPEAPSAALGGPSPETARTPASPSPRARRVELDTASSSKERLELRRAQAAAEENRRAGARPSSSPGEGRGELLASAENLERWRRTLQWLGALSVLAGLLLGLLQYLTGSGSLAALWTAIAGLILGLALFGLAEMALALRALLLAHAPR